MSAAETPVLPPWMDKKILELWLRTHYGEVTVTDFEVRKGTSKGDNYLSDMQRLVLKTKSGDSHHLMIKCRMEEGEAANLMRETSIYRKEQEMYVSTLPKMSALLQKAMPGNVACCVPVFCLSRFEQEIKSWVIKITFIRVILYISYKCY
jgi:hypothetical protein